MTRHQNNSVLTIRVRNISHFIHHLFSGLVFILLLQILNCSHVHADDLSAEENWRHGYADSDGVSIHYVTAGAGPLVVMIHGFPDFWYTWRELIPVLAPSYRVVAIDQRGYNLSDKPDGVENYKVDKLVGDVKSVIEHFDEDKAIVIGHDWGGMVAWSFAMTYPEMTEKLVVLNLPHPNGISRELATNSDQQMNSQYARDFQKDDAASHLTPEGLTFWIADPDIRKKYVEAFKRSSIEGMLNYYKANYPKEPYQTNNPADLPKVKCPVILIHGLRDKALHASGLNNTWEWVANDLMILTIPEADHFVQRDAPEKVHRAISHFLAW